MRITVSKEPKFVWMIKSPINLAPKGSRPGLGALGIVAGVDPFVSLIGRVRPPGTTEN